MVVEEEVPLLLIMRSWCGLWYYLVVFEGGVQLCYVLDCVGLLPILVAATLRWMPKAFVMIKPICCSANSCGVGDVCENP